MSFPSAEGGGIQSDPTGLMSFPSAEGGGIQFIENVWKTYYVYILCSERNGTLYIGVTNDPRRRVFEHKQGVVHGFTKKYNINRLAYYEETTDIHSALEREKQLKKWNRLWKIRLIEEKNPHWLDLANQL